MFYANIFKAAPVMAVLMCGTAAQALTADQVWADWQALATGVGVKVTSATEVKGDGELTLNGVTIAPADGKGGATISEVTLVEEEDGSVTIYPAEIKVDVAPPAGETGKLDITHEGLGISVHEDAGGLGYGLFADTLNVVAQGSGTETFDVSVAFEALDGRYTRDAAALLLQAAADRMTYSIAQKNELVDSKQTNDTETLDLAAELSLPEGLDLMSLQTPQAFFAAARNGLGLRAEINQGAGKGSLSDQNPMMPMNLTFSAEPSTTGIEVNKDVFAFDTTVGKVGIQVLPPMVPAASDISMDGLSTGLSMPVVATEAGEYGYSLKMTNLVMGDGIWGLFDPMAALPREPANVDLDLGGTVKIDMLDLMEASETGTPPKSVPELQTLDIRALGLSVAGAALSGTGAFTFDNALVAAGGPPMPIGTADLRLEGGNKLIEGLIAIGVLKEEDAMGARMMMAMFGKPAGDDVLTSKVEAREGGSIFVNGQQIQ